jgi:plasmid stability protein
MAEDQNRTFQDKFMLRFPEGLRDRIRVAAEDNGRSMNAEIVIRLEASLFGEGSASSTIDVIYADILKRVMNAKKLPTDLHLKGVSARYIEVKLKEQDGLREFFDYVANLLRELNDEETINLNPRVDASWIEIELRKRAAAHGYKLIPLEQNS